MSARYEHEAQVEQQIVSMLSYLPPEVSEFYAYMTAEGKQPRTKDRYIKIIKNFIEFYSHDYTMEFNGVTPGMIDKYMMASLYTDGGRKKTSASSRCLKLAALKAFFWMLFSREEIQKDPTRTIRRPKLDAIKPVVYLTKEEIQILKDNIDSGVGTSRARKYQEPWKSRDLAIVMIALSTGARVESLSEIDVNDIDYDTNELHLIDKGDKKFNHILPDVTMEAITDWLVEREELLLKKGATSDALFISTRRKRMGTQGIALLVKKYTYNIDKHITPHKLRSTFATNLYRETGDIYLVSDVIGHANVSTTQRYAAVSEDNRTKVQSIMQSTLR